MLTHHVLIENHVVAKVDVNNECNLGSRRADVKALHWLCSCSSTLVSCNFFIPSVLILLRVGRGPLEVEMVYYIIQYVYCTLILYFLIVRNVFLCG